MVMISLTVTFKPLMYCLWSAAYAPKVTLTADTHVILFLLLLASACAAGFTYVHCTLTSVLAMWMLCIKPRGKIKKFTSLDPRRYTDMENVIVLDSFCTWSCTSYSSNLRIYWTQFEQQTFSLRLSQTQHSKCFLISLLNGSCQVFPMNGFPFRLSCACAQGHACIHVHMGDAIYIPLKVFIFATDWLRLFNKCGKDSHADRPFC